MHPNRIFTGPSGSWAENDHEEQQQEKGGEPVGSRTRPGGAETQQVAGNGAWGQPLGATLTGKNLFL